MVPATRAVPQAGKMVFSDGNETISNNAIRRIDLLGRTCRSLTCPVSLIVHASLAVRVAFSAPPPSELVFRASNPISKGACRSAPTESSSQKANGCGRTDQSRITLGLVSASQRPRATHVARGRSTCNSCWCYARGLPQFMQNLPVFSVPHSQVHVPESLGAAGFGVPHSMQNLPVLAVPHEGQVQLPWG